MVLCQKNESCPYIKPGILTEFPESQTTKQPDLNDRTVGDQTAHTYMPFLQGSERALLKNCDDINVDLVGYCTGNGAKLIFDDGSRRVEADPHKSYTYFDFIVTMFVIMKLVLELKTKVRTVCLFQTVHETHAAL